jgi:hypothetical protein
VRWDNIILVKTAIIHNFLSEFYYSDLLDSDPEIVTSLRYLSQDTRNPLTKAVTKALRKLGLIGPDESLDPASLLTKTVFVVVQFLYTTLLMLPGYFLFRWYEGCVVYLMVVFILGTWNGASYYIEVFSKR